MRIVETKVFQFDELSDRAKEKARDWFRQAGAADAFWSECVLEDFVTVAKYCGWMLSLQRGTRSQPSVYWSGFWSQGAGACFAGDWHARDVDAPNLLKHAPQDNELARIVGGLAVLAHAFPESSGTSSQPRGHYVHEMSTSIEWDDGADRDDETHSRAEWDAIRSEALEHGETFTELARDLMRWLCWQLESQYESENSDETVDENIRCNEYEFEEDGTRA